MVNRTPLLAIAAVCAVLGPIVLLASDIFVLLTERRFEWSIGLWLAFLLMIPAVIGYTWYLVSAGSRLAYFAGAFAFFGLMAGASMQVLFRVHAVLAEQGSTQVVEQLRNTFKLVASTQMIGIAWPIGLVLLSISTILVDRGRWLISLLFIVGAISFPIGRIAGSTTGVVVSGVVFIVAFAMIAKLLTSRASSLE